MKLEGQGKHGSTIPIKLKNGEGRTARPACHRRRPAGGCCWGKSSVVSRQSSVISRQSSVVSRQSSVISHQSSVVSRQSSVISRQSSVISHQSSGVRSQESEKTRKTKNGEDDTLKIKNW